MDSGGVYPIIIKVIIILFLMCLNGFLTSIYTAVISLNHQKLSDKIKEYNDEKARELLKISQNQAKLMQVHAFSNSFLDILTGVILLLFIRSHLQEITSKEETFGKFLILVLVILLYVIVNMIFSNKIPQRIGVRNPYKLSSKCIGLIKFIMALNSPLIKMVNEITSFFMNIFGIEAKTIEREVTAEQIKTIVQVGEDQGILRPLESKMIHSIMGFDDVWAEEVMTARTEVFMIDISDEERKYLDEFIKVRHSRIPVYDGDIDNILGVIYTKDYLVEACKVGLKNVNIRRILRPAHFVPDKIETDKLFQEMQKDHIHMSILIDEYGGFSGIVSMEDLIEEIVGDIDDLYDKDMPDIKVNANGSYTVKASTGIKDINEKIPIEIDEEDENFDTLGGFIINQLGYIPKEASKDVVKYNGYELRIIYIEDTKIKTVRIKKLKEDNKAKIEEKDLKSKNLK
ncbi:MAG: hemolysin family protein [Peptoniphilaceae bacterium]|nr:hemolysin family protein [Peptoniphilaceae bacterium]MDY6018787.1 hemolysin family protein [Anaerococcus sp.]